MVSRFLRQEPLNWASSVLCCRRTNSTPGQYIDRMARRPLPALETLKLFMREGKGLGSATLAIFASSLLSLAHTAK